MCFYLAILEGEISPQNLAKSDKISLVQTFRNIWKNWTGLEKRFINEIKGSFFLSLSLCICKCFLLGLVLGV